MTQPRRLGFVYRSYPIFFVTACTDSRRKTLDNEAVHRSFENFAAKAVPHGIWVGRYVLMPDHLHLFAAFAPDSMSLTVWVASLKNSLSKTLRERGQTAPHWQRGFFDRLLRSSESYQSKWTYVRMNPVRAGLVVDVNH